MSTAGPFNGGFIGTPQELPVSVEGMVSNKLCWTDGPIYGLCTINPPITAAAVTINLCGKQLEKVWHRDVCYVSKQEGGTNTQNEGQSNGWASRLQTQVKATKLISLSLDIVFINLLWRINGNSFSALKTLKCLGPLLFHGTAGIPW